MKAANRTAYGGPDMLSIRDIPVPVPKENELLIRVQATTVNRTDCGVLWGKPFIFRFFTGLFRPRESNAGTDFAGVVEKVGVKVSGFLPGQRVFGFYDNGCGSHATCITFPANGNITSIPDTCSFEQAAATPEGGHYALNFIRKAKMKAGDRVMVYGATGAIGSAAVQLLKQMGMTVTAVCNTKNTALVRSLGADKVIDFETEDFTKDELRYDHILDAVGKSSFGVCKHLLKPGGQYMSSELGPGNENLYLPLFTRWSKKRVIFPIPDNIKGNLEYLRTLLEKKQFNPVIDRSYPLDRIAEAFEYVNSGQKTGNVIINY